MVVTIKKEVQRTCHFYTEGEHVPDLPPVGIVKLLGSLGLLFSPVEAILFIHPQLFS